MQDWDYLLHPPFTVSVRSVFVIISRGPVTNKPHGLLLHLLYLLFTVLKQPSAHRSGIQTLIFKNMHCVAEPGQASDISGVTTDTPSSVCYPGGSRRSILISVHRAQEDRAAGKSREGVTRGPRSIREEEKEAGGRAGRLRAALS